MSKPLQVLVIEDSLEDTELLIGELQRGGYDAAFERVETEEAMTAALDRQAWDIVFADYRMPHFNGLTALKVLREKRLDTPLIFVSGTIGEDMAVGAMKAGANDYIIKGKMKRLLPAVDRELRESEIRREARRAGEQLRQSEERFRQLAENIDEVFFLTNADAKSMIYISPAYERIWGRSCKSLYDDPLSWLEGVYPADLPNILSQLRKNPSYFEAEYRLIRPDGAIRWIWTRTFPIKDQNGAICRHAGIAEDITGRKLAEEKLRESQEQTRLLLDSTAEAIYGVDLQGRCTFSNQACLRLLGYAAVDDLIGKNMHTLIHHTKEDGTPYPIEECKIYQAFFSNEGAHVNDEVLWRADGTPFPSEYWSYPVYRDGVLIGSVVTFLDITERKRAEEALVRSEERFRQIAENIREVFWMTNPVKNEMLYVSPGYEKIWGRSCRSLYERPITWVEAIHPEDRERVLKAAVEKQVNGTYDEEYRIIQPDGAVRSIRDRAFPIRDASGAVYRIAGIAEDITEQKQAEQALIHSKEFSDNLIQTANVIILGLDLEGKINIFNQTAEEITGYTFAELKGRNWFDILVPEDRYPHVRQEFNRLLADGPPKTFENPILTRTGAERYIMWQNNQVKVDGKVVSSISFGNDITERKEAEEMIQHMAYYDPLTDLPNRNLLYDRLMNAIRNDGGAGRPMALILIDLDHFKEINDTLGHRHGDILLKEVGIRLKNILFAPDVVAHLSGDEFAVFLPRLAKVDDIDLVVQKIQKVLEPPFSIQGLPIAVEASAGVALYPEHGTNPDTLLQRADVAMNAAKEEGKSYTRYIPTLDRHSPQRLALMAELRQAIEEDQLLLHYQPKIGLKSKTVIGVEALARWKHPQRGMIPPDQFIGSAERTGLIHPLTHWVLRTAMRQCGAWRRAGLKITVSANLSARNLLDPKLPQTVMELLKESEVAPEWIEFEITESAIMADPARAQETLARLHEIGTGLSIDDFGIGYSSLSYLQKLPVDRIKVDKSFVIHMTKNEGDAKIVLSTVELSHNLGLEVVAEGVETETIMNRLEEMTCDAAQGYYFSRPLAADDLTRWMSDSPWALKKAGPGQ